MAITCFFVRWLFNRLLLHTGERLINKKLKENKKKHNIYYKNIKDEKERDKI